MSDIFEYRQEIDLTLITAEFADKIQRRIDQATLDKVAETLAEYGYVKIVRCQNCRHYDDEIYDECPRNQPWCHRHDVYVRPDGFCAWSMSEEHDDD